MTCGKEDLWHEIHKPLVRWLTLGCELGTGRTLSCENRL